MRYNCQLNNQHFNEKKNPYLNAYTEINLSQAIYFRLKNKRLKLYKYKIALIFFFFFFILYFLNYCFFRNFKRN